MAATSQVERPFDEIEVAKRYPRCVDGVSKPHLIISLDALHKVFLRENAVLAEEDAPRLVACLCAYAKRSGGGDADLAETMRVHYDNMVEDDDG